MYGAEGEDDDVDDEIGDIDGVMKMARIMIMKMRIIIIRKQSIVL